MGNQQELIAISDAGLEQMLEALLADPENVHENLQQIDRVCAQKNNDPLHALDKPDSFVGWVIKHFPDKFSPLLGLYAQPETAPLFAQQLAPYKPEDLAQLLRIREQSGDTFSIATILVEQNNLALFEPVLAGLGKPQLLELLTEGNGIFLRRVLQRGKPEIWTLVVDTVTPDELFQLMQLQNFYGETGMHHLLARNCVDSLRPVEAKLKPEQMIALLSFCAYSTFATTPIGYWLRNDQDIPRDPRVLSLLLRQQPPEQVFALWNMTSMLPKSEPAHQLREVTDPAILRVVTEKLSPEQFVQLNQKFGWSLKKSPPLGPNPTIAAIIQRSGQGHPGM